MLWPSGICPEKPLWWYNQTMALTLPYPTLTADPANKTELESDFSTISAKFGSIANADISSQAAISIDKLNAQYEYMTVPLTFIAPTTALGMPAAGVVMAGFPMYNDGKGTWSSVAFGWYCNDVGAQTGTFNVKWGRYTNLGALDGTAGFPTTIVSAELLNGGTADTPYNDEGTAAVSMPWTGTRMMLYLEVGTQDATAMSAEGNRLVVTVLLKRKIAS